MFGAHLSLLEWFICLILEQRLAFESHKVLVVLFEEEH